MINTFLKFFATGGFISYIPTAILKNKKNTGAGFLGTLEGVLLYLFFMPQNYLAYAAVLAVFIVFSSVFPSLKMVRLIVSALLRNNFLEMSRS